MACEDDVLPCASCTPSVVPANENHWVATPCGEGGSSGGSSDTDLTNLTAQVAANSAAITTEASARATADSAMASLITTLQATSSTNSAAIVNEATVRASQDSALASTLTSVSATTNLKNRTFIGSTTPVALSTGDLWIDSGNGNRLKRWDGAAWVDTTVASGAIAAAVATETTARTTADSALAAQITALTAVVGTNTAAITTEATTRASADSALATTISSIVAAAGTTSTVFVQTTPPTATSVNDLWFDSDDGYKQYYWSGTSWVDATDTRLTGAIASITTEATARATADTALASSITSLTSTVNGNVSNISTIMSTYATQTYADTKKSEAIAAANAYGDSIVSSEQSARIAADSALSTSISTVSASFGAKNQTFLSGTTPTAIATGDLWIDSSNGWSLKRWNGSAWVDTTIASGAISTAVATETTNRTAAVNAEASARSTADGYLSGKYTLTVTAGNVVTGMNITSSSGSGTPVSDVTFLASNFKIYTSAGNVAPFTVSGTTVTMANAKVTGELDIGSSSARANITSSAFTYGSRFKLHNQSGDNSYMVFNYGLAPAKTIALYANSTNSGIVFGPEALGSGVDNGYIYSSGVARFQDVVSAGGLATTSGFYANSSSSGLSGGSTAVDVKGVNFRVYDSGGAQKLRIDNTNGDVYIQGTRVLRAQYGSTPATLSDVIALLQYMGFCP